jgi:hypothetical protein
MRSCDLGLWAFDLAANAHGNGQVAPGGGPDNERPCQSRHDVPVNPDEELADGWIATLPLCTSTAHQLQVHRCQPLEPDPFEGDIASAALERNRRDVDAQLAEAQERLRSYAPNADAQSVALETADATEGLEGLSVVAAQLYVELQAHRIGWQDYAGTAAADITQNAQTILEEIALLLRHGYVGGAEARWRGLHELACTAALLALDAEPAGISERYLAHGQRLLQDDPAYEQAWAADLRYYEQDYEWLRQSYPRWDKNGKPLRFGQRWLFNTASLQAAAFDNWLKPSHGPVHMSSRAVAAGSEQAGAAPAGYSREAVNQIAWQAACSFYELVAHVALLPAPESLPDDRRLAWIEAAHDKVVLLRPGPVREPSPTPAEIRRHQG